MMKKFLITGAVLATVAVLAQTCYKLQMSEGGAAWNEGFWHAEYTDGGNGRSCAVGYSGTQTNIMYLEATWTDIWSQTHNLTGYPRLVTNTEATIINGTYNTCGEAIKIQCSIRLKPYNFTKAVSGWY